MKSRILAVVLGSLLSFVSFAEATLQPIYIDVRTDEEYAQGHIDNAKHIPYQDIVARIGEVTDDKAQPIIVYCRSGNRSGVAKQMLEQVGFTQVTNGGGYVDLLNSLKP